MAARFTLDENPDVATAASVTADGGRTEAVGGDLAEQTTHQSLIMPQGSARILLRPPIALPITLLARIIFFWPMISAWRARLRAAG